MSTQGPVGCTMRGGQDQRGEAPGIAFGQVAVFLRCRHDSDESRIGGARRFGELGEIGIPAAEGELEALKHAIAPEPTEFEMFNRWMSTPEAKASMADRFPMNYIAHPDDMARAALFLLSDESGWMTGTLLPCEGGKSAG